MNVKEEADRWLVMHVLAGDPNRCGVCSTRCEDPLCNKTNCLRRRASFFRTEIMHGVEAVRNYDPAKYPFIIPEEFKCDCVDEYLCSDGTCQVVGCMAVPAYNFRELIKVAFDEKLFKALKSTKK